jgi:endonuclease YncB( thermonuclease family)
MYEYKCEVKRIVDGKNINLLMVDENHVVKYEGQSKDDIKKEHLVNREKLIQKGLFNPDEV